MKRIKEFCFVLMKKFIEGLRQIIRELQTKNFEAIDREYLEHRLKSEWIKYKL